MKAQVNPLLAALEMAVSTTEEQYDPLLEFEFEDFHMDGWDSKEMLKLSAQVVTDVYAEVMAREKDHQAAKLGSEDIRWLRTLKSFTQ